MVRNIVKAKLDIIFKKIFGAEENSDVLRSFLSSVLEIPLEDISEIVMKNTELLPEKYDGKFSRLDLNLRVKHRLINIEIQLQKHDDFRDRTTFYWATLFTSDLKSGEMYSKLKETICINIVNFNLFDCDDYHSFFKIMETKRHEVLTDKLGIHFFELKKINKDKKAATPMEQWMQLINSETQEDLDMLKQTEIPEIQKAILIIEEMSEDEKVQEEARIREKQLHDEATALGGAKREGLAEGRAEGRAEERTAMIQAMKELGMSEEQIQAIVNRANQ